MAPHLRLVSGGLARLLWRGTRVEVFWGTGVGGRGWVPRMLGETNPVTPRPDECVAGGNIHPD